MKQVGIFVLVLLIIICGGIFEIRYLKKTAVYELYEVEYTKNHINNDKLDTALESAKSLKSSWENIRKTWRLVINHSEIDELDKNILELVSYLGSGDKTEAMMRVETLERDFRHVVENEKVSIENIF